MGCHFLLQGIFPTQGLNLGLPHYKQKLYHLSHQGNPGHQGKPPMDMSLMQFWEMMKGLGDDEGQGSLDQSMGSQRVRYDLVTKQQ